MPAIPPEILRQVRRIELRTRRLVDSRFGGEYPSVFKGQGIEFAEVREYLPGDDVRAIDWNVTARLGRPYVKKYIEERELSVVFAVDVSASQRWGTRRRFKSDVVAEVVATLALSATRNNDRVALLAFSDRIERFIPPRKGRRHVLRLIRDLLVLEPEGTETDLAVPLEYAARAMRTRSIIFLLSDFHLGDHFEQFDRALRFASVRHEVVAIRFADPRERDLPAVGILRVRDPETGVLLSLDSDRADVRRRFGEVAVEDEERVRRLFRRRGVDEIQLRTDAPYAPELLGFFRRRERRLRK